MIKTIYLSSINYEVLEFSLNLLTNIYKTNKEVNGIYVNYIYRDNLSVARMILISNKSLPIEILSKFNKLSTELYNSMGIKIEVYNSLSDNYSDDILLRRRWEAACDLINGDILYDKTGIYKELKENLLSTKKEFLPSYIHTLKINKK